ncbi:MAG: type VI secretion system baseplate subunit TssK [Candidatus Latescibacteria bacterium]|nr:type VI secretion system baseplate subunit TssK [Candidatus Latescibacterota bacterium]
MEPVKPVFWYQGLFLQPQHFQQFDLYLQSLFSPIINHQQPYFWGVCGIVIQGTALKNHTLSIDKGEFIFQDGTWTVFPGNSIIQSRSLNLDSLEAGRPFKVYLGLHKLDYQNENVSVIGESGDSSLKGTRFVTHAEPEIVNDLYQNGRAEHIKLLNYDLKIFWESEKAELGDYYLIPVAELVYDEGQLTLSRNFIPPMVCVSGSEILKQHIHNIREHITSRCHKLEEFKSPREIQTSELDPGYILYILALRSLNRYVPYFHHLTEIPDIHPWYVYGLLRQIIGELSTFTDRVDALGKLMDGTQLLPEYDHEHLFNCFDEAQTLISELLSGIIIGPESIIRLERENGYFKSDIPVDLFEGRYIFYLELITAENQNKVLEAMKNIAKISSIENMKILVGRALPGIPLEYSLIAPPGLPTRPNSYFFKIDQTHSQWVEIQKSQNICLFWDQAPKDTKAEIIVLRK